MTFSILAQDPRTGELGGAAATGSLCVGGWVLRGDLAAGLSASQGASPSTLWGEAVLARMREGQSAPSAVEKVTAADGGRDFRQLAALDTRGRGAAFTGASNTPEMRSLVIDGAVMAGNMLSSPEVIDAMAEAFARAKGALSFRLLAALDAADAAGSDRRGLLSAALLVLSETAAPLTLRIDYSDRPLADLRELHRRATSGAYGDWARQVPTLSDPERTLD